MCVGTTLNDRVKFTPTKGKRVKDVMRGDGGGIG